MVLIFKVSSIQKDKISSNREFLMRSRKLSHYLEPSKDIIIGYDFFNQS